MGDHREPTPLEKDFVEPLLLEFPDLQDWFHADRDGTPWLMLSCDFLGDRGVVATLRLDYDGQSLLGGWSPSCLNWDAEMRASDVPIDTTGPDGLSFRPSSTADAIDQTRAWISARIEEGSGATKQPIE